MGKEAIMNQKETVMLTYEKINDFRTYLAERESAPATIGKYETDVRTFFLSWKVIWRLPETGCVCTKRG